MYIYIYIFVVACRTSAGQPTGPTNTILRPVRLLRVSISEGLTQADS